MCRIDILPSQILHRPTLCPPGVVHHDDEGGAEVQARVQRGACGVHHPADQHPGQTSQDKIYAKGLILIKLRKYLQIDENLAVQTTIKYKNIYLD